MGVRGLSTFLSAREKFFVSHELKNTEVVIDGNNLRYVLYKWCPGLNHCFGGDYDKYGDYIISFFHLLKSCGVKPTVVFDGGYDKTEVKLRTVMSRLREQAKNAVACTSATQAKIQVYPLMAKEMFIDIVKQLGVKVVQCSYEADDVIAHLAASLNCPVLSNDSDFFIFNVDFISLDSLQLDVRADHDDSFLSCEIFDRKKFLSTYDLQTIDHLYLLASLIGNDYISMQSFERIFDSIKMPPKRRDMSDRHRRIKGTIMWLAKHKNAESALMKLLGCFPEKERAKLKEKVSACMLVYSCENVGEEVPIISTDFTSFEGKVFPDWFVDSFHQATLPSWFLDISGRRKLFLISQAESKDEVSSHHIAFSIHKRLIELLTSVDHNKSREVQIFARRGTSFHPCSLTQPEDKEVKPDTKDQLDDKCDPEELTLFTIEQLSRSERKSYIFSLLCPALDEDCFNEVPENLQFITMIMHYWSVNDRVTTSQIVAILASFFVLNFVDSVVGRLRTNQKIERFISTSKQESQNAAVLSSENCLKAIKNVVKYFYMDEKLKSSAKHFNLDLVHSFAKFQSCFFAAASLNKLLGQVFTIPLFNKFYNGTFVYNVTNHLNKVQESTLDKHQWGSLEVTEHFNKMIQSVLKLLPNVNEKISPKKKKKKNMKSPIVVEIEKNDSDKETSENEFYDVQNKFAALSV